MGNRRRVRARMSPLAFFVQACRAELRRRRPEVEVSPTVLSEACAERWRHTSSKERAVFEHLSRVDKIRWERERGAPDGRGRPRKDRQKNAQESEAPGSILQREEAHGEATPFLSEAPKEIRSPEAPVGSPTGECVGASIDKQGHRKPLPSKDRKEVQTYKDKKEPHQEKRPGTSRGNQSRPPRDNQSRPPRDPLQPKRPHSAFLLYAAEHKYQVRSEWPSLNYAEALKKLGEHWAELSPKQRRPFEIRAAALRKKYGSDLAAYQVKNRELGVEMSMASAKGGPTVSMNEEKGEVTHISHSAKGGPTVSMNEEKGEVTHISHRGEPKNEDSHEGLQTSTQLLPLEESEELMDDLGGEMQATKER